MTPSDELLCACLQLSPPELSQLLPAPHDHAAWAALLESATRQRLAPLLYTHLHAAGLAQQMPPGCWVGLEAAYYGAAVTNTLLLGELERQLGRLRAMGVETVLLKGAALAYAYYPDVAARPMRDLDLLVAPCDARRVLDALLNDGYAAPLPGSTTDAHLCFESETMLVRADAAPATVDLHWHLFDSPYYQTEALLAWFWKQRIPLAIGAESTTTFAPAAQLLYLCSHVSLHHQTEGLLWLYDLAQLLRRDRDAIDWATLCEQASGLNLVLAFREGLAAVERCFPGSVPPAVFIHCDTVHVTDAERRVFAWRKAQQRPVPQRFWSDLMAQPTWGLRCRYAWLHIFPDASYMRQRYHVTTTTQLLLRYPYRWWTGLRNAIGYLAARH
jgi:hypothetical protein